MKEYAKPRVMCDLYYANINGKHVLIDNWGVRVHGETVEEAFTTY